MDPRRARQFLPFRNRPNKHGSAGSHDQGEERRNTSMNTGPAKNTYERLRIYGTSFWQAIWHPVSDPPCGGRSHPIFPCGKAFGRLFGRKIVCTYTRGAEIIPPEGDRSFAKAPEQPADGPPGAGSATVRSAHPLESGTASGVAYRPRRTHAERPRIVGNDRDDIPASAVTRRIAHGRRGFIAQTTHRLQEESQRTSAALDRSDITGESAAWRPGRHAETPTGAARFRHAGFAPRRPDEANDPQQHAPRVRDRSTAQVRLRHYRELAHGQENDARLGTHTRHPARTVTTRPHSDARNRHANRFVDTRPRVEARRSNLPTTQ